MSQKKDKRSARKRGYYTQQYMRTEANKLRRLKKRLVKRPKKVKEAPVV